MTEKTLFVHCGGSKTGSSAIQNFLELRRDSLAALGFAYLNPVKISSEHQVQSGNGAELATMLMDSQLAGMDPQEHLQRLVGEAPNAICSSEFFSDMDSAAWNRLHAAAERIGIALRPIFFVRNVIPFLGSLYDQAIKRHGEWRSFDVWSQEGVWQHPRALRALQGSSVAASLTVLHYDRTADCVVEQFLRVIGIAQDLPLGDDDKRRRVNRSLRQGERDALRVINETLGGEYSEELSDMLLHVLPQSVAEPVAASQSIVQLLQERYQADVDWVNKTWFGGEPLVSVYPLASSGPGTLADNESGPAAAVMSPPSHRPAAPVQEIDISVVHWCISKMQQSLDKGIERVSAQLRQIDWEHSMDPAIPRNFDPVAYLLLNPDVLKSRAKPFQHFLEYGQHESGRLWEWRFL